MINVGPVAGQGDAPMKPKFIQLATRFSSSALALGVLVACGGGGSDSLDIADGGIRGTGSSVGPVSGFGSVFVNGVRFDTDQILNGEVLSNDGIECERGCENRLQKGMILRVTGEWRADGTGEAETLEYDDTFRGYATDVIVTEQTPGGEPVAGSFNVLDQTITFDRRTVIRSGSTFESASDLEGELVRVSAWRNGENYRASFIGRIDVLPDDRIELEGPVSNFSSIDREFAIGMRGVSYENDDVFKDGLNASDLSQDGIFVEVEGEQIGGTISAFTIRRADNRRFTGQENEDIEISGPVENYSVTASEFLINGVTVAITDETEFDDFARSRLQDGLLVQVEGEFRNGVVFAEEVELLEGDAEVEAEVTGVGALNNSWIVGGVTVVVNAYTLIDADDGLSSVISAGSFIEVEGIERETDDGRIYVDALAIEIEDEGDDEFELQGRLRPDNFFFNSLTILGLEMAVPPGAIDNDDEDEGSVYDCRYLEVEYEQLNTGGYSALEIECDD